MPALTIPEALAWFDDLITRAKAEAAQKRKEAACTNVKHPSRQTVSVAA